MLDAVTLAVLRDLATFAVVVVVLGVLAYSALRTVRPSLAWNYGGNVYSRPYEVPDVCMAAFVMIFLLSGLSIEAAAAESGKQDGGGVSAMLLSMVVMLLICAAVLMYFIMVRRLNPAELFGLHHVPVLRTAWLALAFIVPLFLLVYGLAEWIYDGLLKDAWPNLTPQETVQAFKLESNPAVRVLMIVAAVVVAPLAEETIFRGVIYGVLKRYTDGYFAAICSALLFAVVHMHVGSVAPLFVLALGFCLAYEVSGSLLVPIWMHAFFNAGSMLLILLGPDSTT